MGRTGGYFCRKFEVQFSPEMKLATCSETFATLPCVYFDRYLLCEVLCRFVENHNMCIKQVESAESESGNCAG